ncbi:MAG: hypothetical protein LCH52_05545 [Bacteroidetes bacterium]|nr:hypothetical protein [Bacteroidota bacterium]
MEVFLIIALVLVFNGLVLAFLKGASSYEYTRILEQKLYDRKHNPDL